eukprot:TRINITY_DN13376_c0_g1_i1.p1 TRINITY_DN13376_c0_g1~~TRINITY_DN13376_c0_g1_i1.p1  ORF type:complete len:289 (+),score=57.25 TRINITY_DN13376_c0_g1_i1:1-867(+)
MKEGGWAEVGKGGMEGATHPWFLRTMAVVEEAAQGNIGTPSVEDATLIAAVLESTNKRALIPHLLSLPPSDPTPAVPFHLLLLRHSTTPTKTLSSSIAATLTHPDAYLLWIQELLLSYSNPAERRDIIKKRLRAAGAMQVGTARETVLEKYGSLCLLADPEAALECLVTMHKLPEIIATQMLTAAITLYTTDASPTPAAPIAKRRRTPAGAIPASSNSGESKIRQLFDKMLKGPAGLNRSAMLWARWISWEEQIDPVKALHVRSNAVRKPGGVAVGDLDNELAKIREQ